MIHHQPVAFLTLKLLLRCYSASSAPHGLDHLRIPRGLHRGRNRHFPGPGRTLILSPTRIGTEREEHYPLLFRHLLLRDVEYAEVEHLLPRRVTTEYAVVNNRSFYDRDESGTLLRPGDALLQRLLLLTLKPSPFIFLIQFTAYADN